MCMYFIVQTFRWYESSTQIIFSNYFLCRKFHSKSAINEPIAGSEVCVVSGTDFEDMQSENELTKGTDRFTFNLFYILSMKFE